MSDNLLSLFNYILMIYKIFNIIALLLISAIIIISTFFYKQINIFNNLYIINGLFSLIIVLEFTFFCMFSNNFKLFNHSYFMIFPISRYKIFIMEIWNYSKRTELLIFLLSIIYFNNYFTNYFYKLNFLSSFFINLLTE